MVQEWQRNQRRTQVTLDSMFDSFQRFLAHPALFKSGTLVFRSENKGWMSLEWMRHNNHIQYLNEIFLLKPLFF